MAPPHTVKWSSGLFSCCHSASTCCYGFWCCPCLACSVSEQFGEARCLPLFDILSPAVLAGCGCPACAPPAGLSLRVAMRSRHGIKGSLCNDILVSCLCGWCSWCQMHREIRHRKKGHATVVNMQPAPVVKSAPVVQPAPVMMAPSNQVIVVTH